LEYSEYNLNFNLVFFDLYSSQDHNKYLLLSLAIGLSLANLIRPIYFSRMTDEDNASSQVTTVMSVTELPRLGGLKADTDILSVKQEIFNQKMTLKIDISIANRNTLLTNRVKCQIYIRLVENEIIQKGEKDSWLEATDHETFFEKQNCRSRNTMPLSRQLGN